MSKAKAEPEVHPLRAELALSVSLILGLGLAVSGVYILAGLGWAMIAGSIPALLLSVVLIRGMLRVAG